MSTLSNLLFRANVPALNKVPDVEVRSIVCDSRQAAQGVLFGAVRGSKLDGNTYADAALKAGCAGVLTDRPECGDLPGRILVASVSDALGPLCRLLHGEPDNGLKTLAVTGTNGKTTSVFLAEAILAEAGLVPALSSTVVVRYPGFESQATMTTPDAVHLWEFIHRARDAGAKSLALEVSSHALDQGRIGGVAADAAVFTNLTRDHLDYHGGMGAYFAAKSRLFTRHLKPGGIAVVNLDDAHGRLLRQALGGAAKGFSFGDHNPDWSIQDLSTDLDGLRFRLCSASGSIEIKSPLLGKVFAQNLAGMSIAALETGLPVAAIERAASKVTVPGRCELVRRGAYRGVVDYAHTPDALERLLEGLRPLVRGRLICVFGCGGDRDRGKRPIMGGIADRLADTVVITSDNPRTENPSAILQEILAGTKGDHVKVLPDRAEAIASAVNAMAAEDLVVVAGKGHEDYQIVGDKKLSFDDRQELAKALSLRENRG